MTAGTLDQTFEFSLHGVELPSATAFEVPAHGLTARLEPGTPLRLKVSVLHTTKNEASSRAEVFVMQLYRQLLLRFAASIERSEPPRGMHQTFAPAGPSPATHAAASLTMVQVGGSPPNLLSQREIDAVAKEVELRLTTSQPATSAQLYTAIDMFTFGLESPNKVVRFLVFYSALALAALFKWHNGGQEHVDKLLLAIDPELSMSPSPRNRNKTETLYTKLRNDLIHGEDRGDDPASAIAAIEAYLERFQRDASRVFSNL